MSRYRCVDTQRAAAFPVTAACEFAGVSTSAYYAWAGGRDEPSPRDLDDAALLAVIRRVHAESDGTYGEPTAPFRCIHGDPRTTVTRKALQGSRDIVLVTGPAAGLVAPFRMPVKEQAGIGSSDLKDCRRDLRTTVRAR